MFSVIFAIVFLLNLFLIVAGSSGAVPFGTLLLIVFLWFGISAPLSAVGSYYGAKHGVGTDRFLGWGPHSDSCLCRELVTRSE
jgi:hypothetical protein